MISSIKKILIVILFIVITGICLYFAIFKDLKKHEKPIAINNFEECVLAGYPVMESYPRQCKTSDNRTFKEDIGNKLEKNDLIIIDNPRPNQIIQSPLVVKGQARGFWFFEGDFPIKLLDESGDLISLAVAQAQSDWLTEDFVPFEAKIKFNILKPQNAILVLEKDNPSDLPEFDDELRIPIKLEPIKDALKIKVFFNNSQMDPEFSCDKVFPVERIIPKTQAVARAALEELLAGPTEKERLREGFFTNLNPGVKIQSLVIENKTAKVDFNEQLEFQVGGSCRVTAIRAQIIETLKQFSTVNDVVISINGRTEDILQP